MEKLVFRCASTGLNVQVWLPDAPTTDQKNDYGRDLPNLWPDTSRQQNHWQDVGRARRWERS